MKGTFHVARTAEGLTHVNTVSQAASHITDVKLVAVYVLDTHEVVRNWLGDWRGDRGSVEFNPRSLPKKDPNDSKEPWSANPWTITRDKRLRLRLDLTALALSAGP